MNTKSCKRSEHGYQAKSGHYRFDSKVGGQRLVHRWVYETHHKISLTPDQLVLHSCNNPWCVEVSHLYLGDRKDNRRDADAVRTQWGERDPNNKLTEKQVKEIRRRAIEETYTALAKEFNVVPSTIQRIVERKLWGWLR